jgi:hypothetical protein
VLTLIDVDGGEHPLCVAGGSVAAADLAAATGWELKPEGLCRGEVCVPLLGRTVTRPGDPARIDLAAWADAVGLLLVDASEDGAAALVPSAAAHASADRGRAPSLTLPDVDGTPISFDDHSGHKRVLVTWASWCGCRHELGGWEKLHQELSDQGLRLFSVALESDPEDARPWIEAARPSYPVGVDTAYVTAERYAITNVPSVVWVDEDDRIVKPPTIAPGDDQFVEFTRIDSARHHDALRAWVATGELPPSAGRAAQPRTDDGQRALGERRIAAYLARAGRVNRARAHLAQAQELAPWDWTVRRGGIAMTGGDPFLGEEFLAFWKEWDSAGRPGYGPT